MIMNFQFVYFVVHAKKKEDLAEIRQYLEAYADDFFTEEPKGNCFLAKSSPITYEHLFQATIIKTEGGWKQLGENRIPDSLDDVVSDVKLFEED